MTMHAHQSDCAIGAAHQVPVTAAEIAEREPTVEINLPGRGR